jgi:uncharacterized protein (TIGR02646 family)
MVRTRRRPAAPAKLTQNKRAWTARSQQIQARRARGEWATKNAKKVLKDPLLALTWGKCAFCEGKLGAQVFAQIEHYISRKVAPHRAFEWKNLLPVCEVCNRFKGHTDHGGSLLKPDAEDPESFFWIGPEGDIQPHPVLGPEKAFRATETIRLCNLNRGELREARQDVANEVRQWLARSDALMQTEWDRLSNPRFPYKIVVRHILTLANLQKFAVFDRRLFQRGR